MTELANLLTERPNPASATIDRQSTLDILGIINREDHKVAAAVAAVMPEIAGAVDQITDRLSRGGRLFYIGAGTSGRLGVLDAAECEPTFHVPPGMVQAIIAGGPAAVERATEASEDDPAAGARDLAARGAHSGDALVGIAASGRTPYVLGAMAEAQRLGALTIGISCTPDSQLARLAAIAITPLPGPEVITGSTRLKAGTATKLVLNMLSTATMIRLGYVFGNLMVNVQPTNHKLRDRACRIIATAGRVDAATAQRLLEESGDSVRTAIVMARLGVSRKQAEARLAATGGRVAAALEGPE